MLRGHGQAVRATVPLGAWRLGATWSGVARMENRAAHLDRRDIFEEHNLNRQLLGTETRVGTSKAAAAVERVREVNCAVETIEHATMLTRDNLPELLAGADAVVDALDRLPIRLVLQDGDQALGIPMVHGSISCFLGQVMTILPGDRGLHALYGAGDDVPERGLEAQLGNPAATPMVVAAWEAQEVVKLLVQRGELLRGRLLVIDMEAGASDVLRLGHC